MSKHIVPIIRLEIEVYPQYVQKYVQMLLSTLWLF